MASPNGILSSEEEPLADGAATEPPPFTFQSDVSDDDDDDDNDSDPLALDAIANATLAAMTGLLDPTPKVEETSVSSKPLPTADDWRASHANHSNDTNGDTEIPDDKPRILRSTIEIRLPLLPLAQRAAYEKVEVDDVWPEEEENYRARRKRKGDDDYDDLAGQYGTRKRRRNEDYDSGGEFMDESEDGLPVTRGLRRRLGPIDDYMEVSSGRRSTRVSTRASSLLVSSDDDQENGTTTRGRRLRLRPSTAPRNSYRDNDRDELQDSEGDPNDTTFAIIRSDIAPTRGRRKWGRYSTKSRPAPKSTRRNPGGSDIEFESRRRSSRPNKTTRVMTENYADDEDDDIFYVEESRTPTAPKITSMREIFQTSTSFDFKEAHRSVCDSCGNRDAPNKGPLIPCQGCSSSYHKACLGIRSTRDHRVTKVAADAFVLQCRYCIGNYKRKDVRAPSHDVCQGCHGKNLSSAPFSEKKTPKQEEILRNENEGVDPIIPVDPKLLDNPDNVLFRCGRCRRAWHYEHLPHPNHSRDPALKDPSNLRKHRREEYQITFMCKECQETEEDKADKIVAWRPVDRKAYHEGQWITDFDEDNLEYLLRWEKKSYNHCKWMPGAWVWGAVSPHMLQAFVKRTFGEGSDEALDDMRHVDNLLRWSEKEAIHDVWITPDIILDVHLAPRSQADEKKYRAKPAQEKFEDDLSRIFHVTKIFVKFEGLGYEDVVWDTPPDPGSGTIYDAFCDAYREYLNGKHFKSEPARVMRERVDKFRQLEFTTDIEVKEQPKGLQRGKLMEYQLEGLNWLLYNFRHDQSVVLADEMGLGKTVQVVALLSSFIQDNPKVWPFLIVVPNATCANWRREIKKWAPDLRVVAYYGGRVSQTMAHTYELFPNGTKEMKAHVVIMSYDSAKDTETRSKFTGVKWAGLVVDEAQALKNDENTLYKSLSALRIPFKLLLTGTPLQNNKRELFNLLQFINPAMKAEELDEKYAQITSDNLGALHDLIRPYFLRRTKASVLTFLPPMAQIIVPVSMSVLQERLCKSILERNPELIRSVFVQGKIKASERGSLSNILVQLRKCLCHPFIYSQAIEDRGATPELARRNLVEASSKLMLLELMLPKLKERGHRVLLFSQFLDQLTILEDFMAGMGLKHARLDGSDSSLEKQKKIDAFNAPNSDMFAMLLSTRAGGVGINLATADTVIILDPDWNPHQDIQALSRAHRIGQQKKVLCFQLVTVDSAEEKILQIGRKKLALDHLLIETMDSPEEAPNDVESVLKYGAAALFGEGKKKDAINYDSAAVDKLLDRTTMEETKTDGDKSAESAFAFARVWANDEGALADDLQETEQTISLSVWEQILQQRAEEARREAERNMEKLGRGGRRRGAANYTSPRFEFDDAQEAAAAAAGDSEQSSVDGDFVDKSDAESTDDERGTVTGESTPNGSNTKKQTSGQDSEHDAEPAERKKARTDPRHADKDKGKTGTTAAVLRPPAAQTDTESASSHASKKSRGQHLKDGSASGKQSAVGSARAGTGTSASTSPQSSRPSSSHHRKPGGTVPSHRPNGLEVAIPSQARLISTTPIPLPTIPSHHHTLPHVPSSSTTMSAMTKLAQHHTALLSLSQSQKTKPTPTSTTTTTSTATQATTQQKKTAAAATPAPNATRCFVCAYSHPPTWECPEMQSEVALRLALDRLGKLGRLGKKAAAGRQALTAAEAAAVAAAVAAAARQRVFLRGKLRGLRGEGEGVGGV